MVFDGRPRLGCSGKKAIHIDFMGRRHISLCVEIILMIALMQALQLKVINRRSIRQPDEFVLRDVDDVSFGMVVLKKHR